MNPTQSTRSSTQRQPTPTSNYSDNMPTQPTYHDVVDMLDAAQIEVSTLYEHIPQLRDELQTQFRESIRECKLHARKPVDLLVARLRGERLVCDAYNKHRLGQVAFRYYKGIPAPHDAEERLAELGEEIDEDLESFPLRFEAVTRGFAVLTEDLLPIYQVADHTASFVTEPTPAQPAPATSQRRGKAAAKTPVNGTTQTKTNQAARNYDKLQGAPASNLAFPIGNVTLAEMAAFHPEALKSWDVIDRFCHNGGSQANFAAMINHFRVMDRGPISNNSVYRMMKGSIEKRAKVQPAYLNWTASVHNQLAKPQGFDPASVSVTGFRQPGDGKKKDVAPPIPIRDMANGVKNFPVGYDALDLTRAVRYCQAHPDEQWLYPDDYDRLVSLLPQDPYLAGYPDGSAPVQIGHRDHACIARYTTKVMAAGIRNSVGRKRDGHGRLLKVRKDSEEEDVKATDTDSEEDSEGDMDFESLDKKDKKRKHFADESDEDEVDTPSRKPANKRKKLAPKPRAPRNLSNRKPAPPSRLRNQLTVDDVDSDSDDDAYADPKIAKKAVKDVRRSPRATKVTKTYNVDEAAAFDDDEEEVPTPAQRKPSLLSRDGMHSNMSEEDCIMDDE